MAKGRQSVCTEEIVQHPAQLLALTQDELRHPRTLAGQSPPTHSSYAGATVTQHSTAIAISSWMYKYSAKSSNINTQTASEHNTSMDTHLYTHTYDDSNVNNQRA